jgi:hypothetical protein
VLDQNVTPTEAQAKPATYDETVAELRRIADALETLGTLPPGEGNPWLSLSILLDTPEGVDAAALALLGKPATTSKNGDTWYRALNGSPMFGSGHLAVQTTVPEPDERDIELTKLRARIAELEASGDRPTSGLPIISAVLPTTHDLGFGYSREAEDDPTPVSPARGPLRIGAVVDSGLVDETPAAAPVHHWAMDFETACGRAFTGLPMTHGFSQTRDAVTCPACIAAVAR